MAGWRGLWDTDSLGHQCGAWALALGIFLVTFTLLPLAKRFIGARRRRLTAQRPIQVHAAIDLAALLVERTNRLFLWGVALGLPSRDLTCPPRVERWLTVALVVLFWMQVALWALAAVRYGIEARRLR